MGRTTQKKDKEAKPKKPNQRRLPAKPKFKIVPGTEIEAPTNLPRPSKGRNLTNATKVKIAKCVCEVYATDKFTFDATLDYFGIKSHATFHSWRKKINEINDLYQNAIKLKEEIYFSNLKGRARLSLEKMIEGYTVLTTETKRTPLKDRNGKRVEGMEIIEEEKLKEVYVRPSPTLIQYVLDNRDKTNFQRNPEPPRDGVKSENEYDHWTEDQMDDEIKRLEKDGY